MGLVQLLLDRPLPANVYDLKGTGLFEMAIEPNTKQPQLLMNVYGSCTVGSWYGVDWVAKRPTIGTLSTGIDPIVGLAIETASTDWTKLLVAGYVYQCASSGTIAAGADVEILSTGVTVVIDGGADIPLISANGIGHAQVAAASSLVDVWLLGREVSVAGS